jgi:hypothetical protein
MKVLPVLAWVALLAVASSAEAEEVTFTRLVPPVGTVSTETGQIGMTLKVTISIPGKVDENADEAKQDTIRKRETVLASDAETITSVKVEYQLATEDEKNKEGKTETTPKIVQGRAYQLTRENKRLVITDLEGKPATGEEVEFLKKDYLELEAAPRLGGFLHRRKVAVGEVLELPGEAAREALRLKDSEFKVELFEAKLKEVRAVGGRPCAVFDARVKLFLNDGGAQLAMEPKGELIVTVEQCWLVSTTLAGAIKISGQQAPGAEAPSVAGEGQLKVGFTTEYEVPAAGKAAPAPPTPAPEK